MHFLFICTKNELARRTFARYNTKIIQNNAQADLSLHWAHMLFCLFCHEAIHFVWMVYTSTALYQGLLQHGFGYNIYMAKKVRDILVCYFITMNHFKLIIKYTHIKLSYGESPIKMQ